MDRFSCRHLLGVIETSRALMELAEEARGSCDYAGCLLLSDILTSSASRIRTAAVRELKVHMAGDIGRITMVGGPVSISMNSDYSGGRE